ncbi:MAG: hypothetical protein JSW28_04780 [Thermoplasmata archaeon]|nr:MAG: hypothetical protein JSW28_04780 [Thermoplasmata archaeon]
MKETLDEIEFFGIDFGIKKIEMCTGCGDKYISDEVYEEVEKKARELGLFGLERKVKVTKSGNSLVLRLPPDIVKFAGIKYKDILSILPIEKGRFEIKVL